jgi:CheY-like chemotaxis protein
MASRPSPRRARAQRQAVPRPEAEKRAATVRVLLVDDDAALRTLYRFNLEASGMSVVEAPDGEAALELLRGPLPDVVLLDVMMPGVSGWDVAARIAADPRTAELPIIFVTALADQEARDRGGRSGATGYLTKPLNPVLLADEIDSLLASARRGEGPARRR